MCCVEVRVWLILKALVCAHAVFMSGVTYSLQYVILEQGHLGKSLDISCRILEIAVKFASKLYNYRKLLSNVWGRACRWNWCSIPSFWIIGKSC
jgi:hypothetical protein